MEKIYCAVYIIVMCFMCVSCMALKRKLNKVSDFEHDYSVLWIRMPIFWAKAILLVTKLSSRVYVYKISLIFLYIYASKWTLGPIFQILRKILLEYLLGLCCIYSLFEEHLSLHDINFFHSINMVHLFRNYESSMKLFLTQGSNIFGILCVWCILTNYGFCCYFKRNIYPITFSNHCWYIKRL